MNTDPLCSRLEALVKEFRSTAHDSLARIGQSLGVECSEGHYDNIMSAVRSVRTGVVNDEEGRFEYRFHGSGCEVRTASRVVDFNIYPKHKAISPIMAGPYGFKKYVCSAGIKVDEETVMTALEEAVKRGLVDRLGTGSYYSFSPGIR